MLVHSIISPPHLQFHIQTNSFTKQILLKSLLTVNAKKKKLTKGGISKLQLHQRRMHVS